MDYFLGFHWWYILVGVLLLIAVTGKSKGGVVVKRYSAAMEILDDRFKDCIPEAEYSIFKEGKPDKIEIEVDKLFLAVGETLEIQLNGSHLANMDVKPDKEAEFEHWSDEGVEFPKIKAGDVLVIKYLGRDVLKGTFQ